MKDKSSSDITFEVTIYFSNGITLQRSVPLKKAYKLSIKKNVIIEPDVEVVEIRGINNTIIIPINMTFVVNEAPKFDHVDKVSRYMLYKRDDGKCAYCGKSLSQKESTIDHIIPKDKGGLTTWDNCVISCKPCNNFKDNKTLEESGMKLLIHPYNPKKNNKKKIK